CCVLAFRLLLHCDAGRRRAVVSGRVCRQPLAHACPKFVDQADVIRADRGRSKRPYGAPPSMVQLNDPSPSLAKRWWTVVSVTRTTTSSSKQHERVFRITYVGGWADQPISAARHRNRFRQCRRGSRLPRRYWSALAAEA